MRIRQERLDSNVRVSKMEAGISEVIMNTDDTYVEEILLALQNVQARWINMLRNEEIPSLDKEDDEEEDEGSIT